MFNETYWLLNPSEAFPKPLNILPATREMFEGLPVSPWPVCPNMFPGVSVGSDKCPWLSWKKRYTHLNSKHVLIAYKISRGTSDKMWVSSDAMIYYDDISACHLTMLYASIIATSLTGEQWIVVFIVTPQAKHKVGWEIASISERTIHEPGNIFLVRCWLNRGHYITNPKNTWA